MLEPTVWQAASVAIDAERGAAAHQNGGSAEGSTERSGDGRFHGSTRTAGATTPWVLPPLLRLLATRERRYMAAVRANAEPVGRHGTGAGRLAARDPLSFGFDGSIVIDEDAEKALRARRHAGGAQLAHGSSGSSAVDGVGAVSGDGSATLPPSAPGTGLLSWLKQWPHKATAARSRSVPTGLLEEHGVPLSDVYEVGKPGGSADHRVSYQGRMHEMAVRQAHLGVAGTSGAHRAQAHTARVCPDWMLSLKTPSPLPPAGCMPPVALSPTPAIAGARRSQSRSCALHRDGVHMGGTPAGALHAELRPRPPNRPPNTSTMAPTAPHQRCRQQARA